MNAAADQVESHSPSLYGIVYPPEEGSERNKKREEDGETGVKPRVFVRIQEPESKFLLSRLFFLLASRESIAGSSGVRVVLPGHRTRICVSGCLRSLNSGA